MAFNLAEGAYKLRVDYLGYPFWSPVYAINGDLSDTLTISHQDVTLTIEGDYPSTEPISNIPVYLFNEAGSYLNQHQTADTNGQAVFNLPEQSYKVRADYMGQHFWSNPLTWQDATVTIPMADAEITVTCAGVPVQGVTVYVFTASGSYLSINDATDANGKVSFHLAAGEYKFRADYQGSHYWSDPVTLTAGQVNLVGISTGGGNFNFTVLKGSGVPLTDANCYVFSESGSYLNISGATDASGQVSFNLAQGTYKLRVDYLGYQFWSPVYTVSGNLSETLTIPHQDVTITVQGDYPSAAPVPNIPVYLFNEAGSYLSQHQTTDANGHAVFNLPEKSYKVRADYQGQQFWSNAVTWQDTTVTVPMADAEITVTGASAPVEGVKVYVFSASGAYLSLNGVTDADGKVSFHLAAGEYKFRADYQGSHYWSNVATLTAGQVNPVEIPTNGGGLTFTVLKGSGTPLGGVNCYVFSESGSYLSISDTTDASGQVSFNLADGTYKIRVDYLGYQFWSPVYTVSGNLTETFTIAHQVVTLTVQGNYPSMAPISGVPVYLFTEGGAYVSQYQTTDADGHVTFNLPQQSYKVRADFLGRHFWSDPFTWQNTAITINQGMASVHVVRSGSDVANAKVYLFSEAGAYLGINQTTDGSGKAEFLLSNTSFKFRVDEGGNQYWSPVINIQPGVVNNVDIDISPITVSLSADPESIQAGQPSTLTWNSTGANTCAIEPGIGTVDASGSMQVSPDVTTTYTITATGPSGTSTASTTVTVNIAAPPFSETKLTAEDPSDFSYFGGAVSIYGDTAIVGAPGAVNNGVQSGAAYIYKYNGSSWVEQARLVAGDGTDWDYFGWSVSIYGNTAVVGADSAYSQGLPIGAVYVFQREGSTWTQQAKLMPNDTNDWTFFGGSVSIYGDYIIVGAEGDGGNGIYSGAAYIFRHDGSAWTQQTKLTASNGQEWSFFGHSVSIYGEYAIVGDVNIIEEDETNCAAYIYKTDGSSWTEQARLFVDGMSDDGSSVSIYKDYAVVGTPWSIKDGIYQGAAFVFKQDGSVWNQQAQLTASDPTEDNYFGSSVAIYENYAVVGAYGNKGNGSDIGAAYIFKHDGSTWSEQTKLTASDSGQWPICDDPQGYCSGFGRSVALHGGNAIIGAFNAAANGVMPGAAYIYTIPTIGVKLNADPENIMIGESSTLSWSSDHASSCVIEPGFGPVDVNGSITVSPTVTTTYTITATGPDGTATDSKTVGVTDPTIPPTVDIDVTPATIQLGNTAIISWNATRADTCVIEPGIGTVNVNGSVQVSPNATTTYTITATGSGGTTTDNVTINVYPPPSFSETNISPADLAPGDNFGQSVSLSEDYSVIGSPKDSDGGYYSGSVYIFERDGSTLTQQSKLTAGDAAAYDYFGSSVSVSGDYVIVGAYGDDDAGESSGAAYIFKREGTTWVQQAKLVADDAAAYDYFGSSVSISGDYAIVGAYGDDDGGIDSGAAYFYKREGTTWIQQAKFKANDAAAYDYFGWSVSIDSDYAIVGAYGNDDAGESSGAAYIFNKQGEQTKITANDAEAYDYFGYSVDISKNYAIVGAYGDDDEGINSGAAYIFASFSPWTQQAKITNAQAIREGLSNTNAFFGNTVAIEAVVEQEADKIYIAVGAPGYYTADDQWETVSVFTYDGNRYTLKSKVIVDYGQSVDINNGAILVGAPKSNNAGQDSGGSRMLSFCTADIKTDPGIIQIGASATLTWNTENADSISIDHGIGTVSAEGSLAVSPQETTTYTITATSPTGTSFDTATVNVIDPSVPPEVEISATPDHIYLGGSSTTLTWRSTNADSCVIEPGIGSVDLSGSKRVTPLFTTAYTITATGPAGTARSTVTVIVNPLSSNEYKLTASDAGDGDYFGNSVSISGDYAIVGATGDDDVGSAYIFKRDGSTWVQQAKLIDNDAPRWASFGCSVSIDGDYAVVGAQHDDVAGYSSGSAYIFKRDGTTWVQQAKLIASDAAAYDYFGNSVSISGDTVIVGANASAYIFKRDGTTWVQQAKLTASGTSVSISGDTVIVGANDSAYIFKRDGTTWVQQAKLIASDAADGDYFGYSVSISGDTVIVGAWGNDDDGDSSGSAYIFKRDGSVWTQQAKLTASDAVNYYYFGFSVFINGDVAVIGAVNPDLGGGPTRSSYLFKRDGSTWTEFSRFISSDAAAGDYFGYSVSISGDTVIVGAWGNDDDGDSSGSAYVYNFSITTANIKAGTETINVGESATLTWDTENADSISIDQGIGTVSAEGSLTVSPQETTTYTITATGAHGTSTENVTVNVIDPSVPPTVNLSATPDTITLGETFILNWNSTNASFCVIEPGIGGVDINGPMKISLGATTTYTITATGPAGTATKSVTIIVNSPTVPPTVALSSNPETVPFGQPAILTWNSTNAYSCTIEPGIGRVGLNGSINVSPAATTAYTITATGYAGTVTSSATVTVIPLPTVNFSANPSNITAGESATLTWSSANADSCVIEPGIGSVDLNGSSVVSPSETTTYTITATGPGGETSESVTINVTSPVSLQITSPVHMQNISRPDILVEGTISDAIGIDMGVTVNGQVATIFNGHFVANHVPLQEGENTITVIGTDSKGNTATAQITVYAQTTGSHITINADTDSGVSPFETTLQVEGTFDFSQEPVITPNGPDDVDPLESLGDAKCHVGITTPGIYYFTAQATDDQSSTYTDRIAVVVLDQAQLNALLRAKWDGMKTALINRNLYGALAYFANGTKDNYQQIFSLLTEDKLQGIASGMREIEKIYIEDNRAKYGINREETVQGVLHEITYIVYFVKDGDGLWKIESF